MDFKHSRFLRFFKEKFVPTTGDLVTIPNAKKESRHIYKIMDYNDSFLLCVTITKTHLKSVPEGKVGKKEICGDIVKKVLKCTCFWSK